MPELQCGCDGKENYRLNGRNPVTAEADMSIANVKGYRPGKSQNVVKTAKGVL